MGKQDYAELVERLDQLSVRITAGANETCAEAATAITTLSAQVEAMREALEWAILQLEYMDGRSPSGSTPAVIARLHDALAQGGE